MTATPMNVRVFELLAEKRRLSDAVISTTHDGLRMSYTRKLQAVLADIDSNVIYGATIHILETKVVDGLVYGKEPQVWVDDLVEGMCSRERNPLPGVPTREFWPGKRELTYTPPTCAS